MPAANIIAIHDDVLNSGCSSDLPRRIVPKFENAITKTKNTKIVPKSTNAQPRLLITQLKDVSAKLEKLSVANRPQATTAATTTRSGTTMLQSIFAFSSSAASSTCSSASTDSLRSPRRSATMSSASSLVADGAAISVSSEFICSVLRVSASGSCGSWVRSP